MHRDGVKAADPLTFTEATLLLGGIALRRNFPAGVAGYSGRSLESAPEAVIRGIRGKLSGPRIPRFDGVGFLVLELISAMLRTIRGRRRPVCDLGKLGMRQRICPTDSPSGLGGAPGPGLRGRGGVVPAPDLARPSPYGAARRDHVLVETLDALEMPRQAAGKWLRKSRQTYCLDHGGRQYYAELMDLFDEALKEAEHSS